MRIVIVGGGCSGYLVALHLLRMPSPPDVTVVEPRAELGLGLAFSTRFDGHLLNVPAGRMSAFPAEPSHFLDWLTARNYPGAAPGCFTPRRLFGEYLAGLPGPRPRHIRAEVVAIELTGATDATARLTLSDASKLDADKVVLALGNPDSGAWAPGALRLRHPEERILLIGAGQTAVDAVLALQCQSPDCRITLLSRSGVLPQIHPDVFTALPAPPIESCRSIREILRILRAEVRRAKEAGLGWQAVVDSLRPVSNKIWQGLPVPERRRFHRHLKTLWETHRSRMPPEIHAKLHRLISQGQVEVIAGRIAAMAPGEARVTLRRGGERRIRFDRAINCTGIHENYRDNPRPLLRQLMDRGLATPNELDIGLMADPDGAVTGPASHLLFTLGPMRRGGLFETIAVPEIRVQAEALARRLCGN